MTSHLSLRGAPATKQSTGAATGLLRSARNDAWLVALALAVASPALADSSLPPAYWANRQLPDARQEARAKALMEELRCLVCQGQSIADSDAEIAGDMRDLVRRRVAAGERPSAIRGWLVERYGHWVSYRPPTAPVAWPLWLAPILLLGAGALLVVRRLRLRGRG
jgi:cytochrome c-type biogenesis protein CcmH